MTWQDCSTGSDRATARHHWLTILVWLVLATGLVVGAKASGGETVDVFTIPGAQSQQAADLLEQRFPSQSGDTANVVFAVRTGSLTDTANAAAIAQVQENLAALPDVANSPTAVVGPATPVVGGQFVGPGGKIGYTHVQFDEAATSLPSDTFDAHRSRGPAGRRRRDAGGVRRCRGRLRRQGRRDRRRR